jgi:probable rRNA maturation factor
VIDVVVVNRQRGCTVRLGGLGRFVRRLALEIPPPIGDTVALCLVTDAAIREMNREFRGLDRATDVLAFRGHFRPDPEGSVHLGDIAIAVPTAARQARARGHALSRELRTLALHGYLHLLGFDHERDDGRMRRLERRIARRLIGAAVRRRPVS